MYRKIFLFIISLFLSLLLNTINIAANQIFMYENYNVIKYENRVSIYENNVLKDTIYDIEILDLDKTYLLYNNENSLYLYNLDNSQVTLISDMAYNAQLSDGIILFESDKDSDYTCKNVIGTVNYRNCYKIYLYDIELKNNILLELEGNDNYLNDFENDYLIYTSIHSSDKLCSSVCSFINIYNFKEHSNLLLDKYLDINLDMSGNGYISDNLVFFESIPNIYDCNYSQIFAYNLTDFSLEMITQNSGKCFNTNSEIIEVSNGYLIFKSRYDNYDNSEYINYIYSYDDYKYKIIENDCKYNQNILNDSNQVYCLDQETIISFPIDNSAPTVNSNKLYSALKENEEKLISQIEYQDDLSSKENIRVELIDNLSNVGEQFIKINFCDKFNNCQITKILVEVIDQDITPPKIYCQDSITIKINEEVDIKKYGFALDNVDGKLSLEIVENINLSKKGTYNILVKSEDSSGNVAYKEIELVIYDNLQINLIYYLFIILTLVSIIIIYIFRFKKSKQF